jgi:type IV pilus assembly protein PilV
MRHHSLKQTSQSGFSLIEVLVAMLVMAIGAGGLAILLLSSVQGTVQAQDRSHATIQAANLAQLIYANPSSLGHFLYAESGSRTCDEEIPCSGDWAGEQLQSWQLALEQQVAHSRGVLCRDSSPMDGSLLDPACDGSGDAVIKIVWQAPSHPGSGVENQRIILPLPGQ